MRYIIYKLFTNIQGRIVYNVVYFEKLKGLIKNGKKKRKKK